MFHVVVEASGRTVVAVILVIPFRVRLNLASQIRLCSLDGAGWTAKNSRKFTQPGSPIDVGAALGGSRICVSFLCGLRFLSDGFTLGPLQFDEVGRRGSFE